MCERLSWRTETDTHIDENMFKNGWQQRRDFSFCLCLSSRHPFIVHRLTWTCTIEHSSHIYAYITHSHTHTSCVNPYGNHFCSLCLTNCSNGYFSFDHAYRIIQASLTLQRIVTKYSCNLMFHERPSYVLRWTKIEPSIIAHPCLLTR